MRAIWIRVIGVLLLAGCTAGSPETPGVQSSRPYTHPSGVFSMELPPTWLVGDLSRGPALHMSFAAPEVTRPLLQVYAIRLAADIDDDTFGRTMGAYLRASHNQALDVIDTSAMGDGSWRVTAVRNAPGEALPVNIFMQRDGPFFSALEVAVPGNDAFTTALLALMVNSYRVDPGAPRPVGTLDDLPAADENLILAAGNLAFSNLLAWTDPDGRFHITGLVANQAAYPLEAVQVTARVLDGAGGLLAEAAAAIPVSVLLDGEQAPFDLRFDAGWPRLAARYELHGSAQQATAALAALYPPDAFAWEDRAEYDDAGRLHIRGTVWNQGDASARALQAVVTVFDALERVTGVVVAPIGDGVLAPGASARFDVPLGALGGDPIRYQLTLHGQR